MEANELRIGNYVLDKYGNYKQIKAIAQMYVYLDINSNDWFGYDEIKPIPLTEDWLIKLGFTESEPVWSSFMQHWFKIYSLNGFTTHGRGDVQFYDGRIIKCKYVHELQNLYFSITKKELIYD